MRIRLKLIAIAIAAALPAVVGVQAAISVPAGFEELARGQNMMLDVSLYGESLGVVQARVDLEDVQFLQPEALAGAVLKKFADAPGLGALLSRSLNSPLKRNGNLACSTNGRAPGCDHIETDSVAAIYDENNAKVALFLGRQYRPSKKNEDVYYDASTESKNALVHQQNLNFVADSDYQSASVQGNGSLGVTETGYLNIDWNWQGQRSRSANMQKADVTNAYFRQDLLKRVYLQGGLMDARDIFSNAGGNINLSQLPLGKISGARVGSTLSWVNMDKVSRGTPVNVFLTRDSRVDAYRDGQLLSSFYLKAGAQELDTRTFPAGSYTISLSIYENNQLVRTETVPYTGTGGTPLSSFQWFVQAGNVSDDSGTARRSDDDSRRVVQGGLRLPVTENTSLTGGAALFSAARYWEGVVNWVHGFDTGPVDGTLTTRASYLYGTDGSRGNIQQFNYNDGFSLSFYRSAMAAPDCNSQGEHRYSYSGCYKSTNVMLSVPFSKWYGTLGYALSNNEGRYVYRRDLHGDDRNSQTGIPWEQVYQTRSRSRTWQTGITRYFNWKSLNANAGVNAFMRKDTGYDGTDKGMFLIFTLSHAGSSTGQLRSSSSAGASWQTSRRGSDQLSYNAAYSRYIDVSGESELGASLYGVNTDTMTSSAYGRAGGQYGNGALTVSDALSKSDGTHRLSSSGSYSSSLAIDRSGPLWGRWGNGTPSSAVMIGVEQDNEQKDSRVSVSLDSGGRSNVRGNSRALFTVPGYRQTTFSVTEAESSPDGISSELRKGAGSRTVFLTPGKVFSRSVEVDTRYTWLGRMTDAQRRPLEGGIPLNVMSWTPLGGGGFTLETSKRLETLYVMKDSEFWRCGMKVRAVRNVVRYVGTTTCESSDVASLPVAEQKQVRLITVGASANSKPTAMNK
ncbi:TcfC E-set like domain-containing protein [Candidatus Erwinia dacicola]|uniref:Fimbrial protein n=1 Tax=Candidatus Erwinia dacicola TaxID=252393 RepID=A0A1E7Z1Q8_9GAMM|nr:TcfC E-set like domain-containing protein [Candidatus Erwinia dacicola]OFC62555.1 fimbrial protein [Candidatus Erwinia dacicola]RAP71825.1 putative outer membrane fimbrial usher protein [Candidatus Erwinia dacicola]